MSDEYLNSGSHHQLQIINEEAMTRLGAQLAVLVTAGLVIYLEGDLGAGKTTLVRGFLRALGYQGAVKSPTFTVVEPYSLDYNKLYDYNKLEQGLKLEDKIEPSSSHELERRQRPETSQEPDSNKLMIYHFDLYRLEDPEELEYLGIRDYLDGQSIALIEWPEKGGGVLPGADITIKITHQKQGREVELMSQSANGVAIVSKLVLDTEDEAKI